MAPTPLRGADFVQAVRAECDLYAIDVRACFANALHEGIGGGLGYHGTRYGPWQLAIGVELPAAYGKLGPYSIDTQAWAWSIGGVKYAVKRMNETGARGLKGHKAVEHIARYFEHVTDLATAYKNRDDTYDHLLTLGSGAWRYLAGLADGPAIVTSPVEPATVAAQVARQRYVNEGWHSLLRVMARTNPAHCDAVMRIAHRLPKAVR